MRGPSLTAQSVTLCGVGGGFCMLLLVPRYGLSEGSVGMDYWSGVIVLHWHVRESTSAGVPGERESACRGNTDCSGGGKAQV